MITQYQLVQKLAWSVCWNRLLLEPVISRDQDGQLHQVEMHQVEMREVDNVAPSDRNGQKGSEAQKQSRHSHGEDWGSMEMVRKVQRRGSGQKSTETVREHRVVEAIRKARKRKRWEKYRSREASGSSATVAKNGCRAVTRSD
jgi:hypothetical protein